MDQNGMMLRVTEKHVCYKLMFRSRGGDTQRYYRDRIIAPPDMKITYVDDIEKWGSVYCDNTLLLRLYIGRPSCIPYFTRPLWSWWTSSLQQDIHNIKILPVHVSINGRDVLHIDIPIHPTDSTFAKIDADPRIATLVSYALAGFVYIDHKLDADFQFIDNKYLSVAVKTAWTDIDWQIAINDTDCIVDAMQHSLEFTEYVFKYYPDIASVVSDIAFDYNLDSFIDIFQQMYTSREKAYYNLAALIREICNIIRFSDCESRARMMDEIIRSVDCRLAALIYMVGEYYNAQLIKTEENDLC